MEPMHPDWQGKLTLGALPLPLFANGHGYFVQSAHTRLGVAPFAVHATYTLDRHDGLAKRQRFREAGLWSADPISPPTERFLVLNSSVPPAAAAAIRLFKAKGESANNIGVHRLALMGYLTELRDAIALARALGRTLILPRHQCFCDRLWAGSDDILRFGCMYPGSQDHPFLPFACPMDHWLVPHVWEGSGLAFRDAIFIERLLSAEPRTSVRDMRIVPAAEWHRACAAKAQARFAGVVGDCWDVLPAGLWTAEEMRAHLHASGSAQNAQDGATRVLRLEHSRSLLCGVSSKFRRIRQRPVRPTDCSGSCCASPLGARAAPTATSGCASGRCRPVAAGSGAKSGASKCRPRRSSTRAAACSAETAQVTLYENNFRVPFNTQTRPPHRAGNRQGRFNYPSYRRERVSDETRVDVRDVRHSGLGALLPRRCPDALSCAFDPRHRSPHWPLHAQSARASAPPGPKPPLLARAPSRWRTSDPTRAS